MPSAKASRKKGALRKTQSLGFRVLGLGMFYVAENCCLLFLAGLGGNARGRYIFSDPHRTALPSNRA